MANPSPASHEDRATPTGASATPDRSVYCGNLLFSVGIELRGEAWWIAVRGELDLSTAPTLEREILACEARDDRPIVIDLGALAFMDVAGLRVLLAASGRSRTGTNRLSVIRGPRAVRRVIELTGSEALLPFTDRPGGPAVSELPGARNDSRGSFVAATASKQARGHPQWAATRRQQTPQIPRDL